MPNSQGKKKSDNYVWSNDEVELLLNVVPEYKTSRTALDLFRSAKAFFSLTLLAESFYDCSFLEGNDRRRRTIFIRLFVCSVCEFSIAIFK